MSLQAFAFCYFGHVPSIWTTWSCGVSSFDFLRICHVFPIVVAAFYKVNNSAQVFECLLLLEAVVIFWVFSRVTMLICVR